MSRRPRIGRDRRATIASECSRCGRLIKPGHRIVPKRGGGWIHEGCASGQDDQ